MKSVGEAMGIGRTFTEAFLKALRLARARARGADAVGDVSTTSPRACIRGSVSELARARARARDSRDILRAKRAGWGDDSIGAALGRDRRRGAPRCATRRASGPSYRRVDSCAGEVEAASNYFYSTWGEEDEALPAGDEAARRHPRLRPEPDRPGDRVRLLLRPRGADASARSATRP